MAATHSAPTPGTTRVPMLDLQAQYQPIRDEILATITRVCDSQRFIMGPEIEALESELAAMLEVRHAVGVSSGTDALLIAMMALGIGPGDEVITSTFSFFATAGCVARLGATPVFVDIDPVTFNIDPRAAEAAITPRTKAIIPVHLYGQSAEMDPILAAAAKAGVAVIEDAAQAIGARYSGRTVGSLGTFGAFSFFPSKNLGAFGDGGLVTTQDDALGHTLKVLRVHGGEKQYYHTVIGGNFRLDAIQAAVLRVKARHLAGWTEGRRRNAQRYGELFRARGLEGKVVLPAPPGDRYHIYNQYLRQAAAARPGQGPPRFAQRGHRDLLPGAVPSPGLFRAPRLQARAVPTGRGRSQLGAGPADLRRADRGPAALRR